MSREEDLEGRDFLDAAVDHGVRSALVVCEARAKVVRTRLERRDPGASEADWLVCRRAA